MGIGGHKWLTAAWSCLAAVVGAGTPASAGGFYSPYQSGTAIGTAFAGASARSDDASFFFYNPATVSGLAGTETYTDARVFLPSVRILPSRAVSPSGADVTAAGGSGNMAYNAIAPGGATAVRIGPRLTLGFATSVPFGSDVDTSADWGGRFHLLRSTMIGLNGQSAVSWQATPWLAVAVGLQVQWFKNHFENAVLLPGLLGPVETKAYLKTDGWAVGAVAGLVLTPSSGTRIGLSWRSPLTHRMEGTAGALLAGVPTEHVRYDVDLPQVLSVGVEHRLSASWRLFGELQWTDWTRFNGFDFSFASGRPNEVRPINWQGSWLAAVGLGCTIAPGTEVTAGLSWDTSASPDGSGTTLSPDANKTMLGLGLIHELPGLGRLSLSYAHVFVEDAPVVVSGAGSGTLEGALKGRLDIVAMGFSFSW